MSTVEWAVGLPGINGLIQMTILNSEKVPPLTPVGLFSDLTTLIDLGRNTLTYKNKKSQKLTVLPSGHVSHSIVNFSTL